MHYFSRQTTGHAVVDAIIRGAMSRWQQLVARGNQLSLGELVTPASAGPANQAIPSEWVSCFYLLPHIDQVVLAFAWLHWWQQSSKEEEPGFAGWLHSGPGFALNHALLLEALTHRSSGVLGIIHSFLETILARAGDWDGDRVTGQEVVKLLADLDVEYRYNVHDRELWPAVFQLVQEEYCSSP
ncbi:MAG TPA: hypothetical protein VGX03_37535 [Candidatus Binatia bacterium]|jgi:hypothetical protein|nr:hypothetical protein [Candidatus Binatia bacterium]